MTLRPENSLFRPGESVVLENIHIGIAGLIGAGKTTLATALAKALNLTPYYEKVVDNIYLADFYKDPKKHSFALQIYLLNHRFRQQQQIIWQGKGGVQDRTIYEDSVFAKMLRDSGLLDERDYQTYCHLFANMSNFMNKPNLIIFLDVSPEESLERIKQRSRDCESTISLEYLQNLYRAYNEFILEIARAIPVIRVNYSKFRTAEEMAAMIKEEYEKMRLIHTVDFDSKTRAAGSAD
eukprot:TRINITY_DN5994_c0_g1_i2.p1 TRINITY_DN5994_c0_g1~~TRINITY_DN5994_c0_g1_i2.p1  ORF type:complete len:237 (+),score=71.00 TRINITY_DN5994_c0_g1_i2:84-794(+)